MAISFQLNGKTVTTQSKPSTPLLWVLRDEMGLTGTKYGCGVAQCGACMVHVDGSATPSCAMTLDSVSGSRVTTIEGLSSSSNHAVQRAWAEIDVPQCGYCQSGQIMTAAALLRETPNPTDSDIDAAMTPVLCRCGTYPRIRAAIKRAAQLAGTGKGGAQ